ncbi:hypothetical protein [Adhaeribacter radiodurans]|uniref:Lipoprotein n=1 Tax=Adhaeribacter radiodurans TaxID=2745197 RepID=A0A7L7LC97_9BACT|nr:hypothetical protein [Adhaeribacter radiodurans]QMU30324.1 hypothetical protein HUW48_20830 [Adhaeribacter radiodurans]
MKKIFQTVNKLSMVLLLGAALSLSACSTGTKDGDTNVEDGSAKNKNPENENIQQPVNSAAADSAANSDDPDANKTYQKVDPDNGTRDADNDGQADK